jgi:hypothetical protein
MIVSLHLCDETVAFAQTLDEESKPLRVLDVAKLNPDGLQTFALSNTGTGDFAAGALAMLELLEATLGRPLNICAESDPKLIAENSASSEPAP